MCNKKSLRFTFVVSKTYCNTQIKAVTAVICGELVMSVDGCGRVRKHYLLKFIYGGVPIGTLGWGTL